MDPLFPYDIVEENGSYGLKDNTGNFVVPCIMDEIVNLEDEELGLSLWGDYGCIYLYKDCKIGFFTHSGFYIAPIYDEGAAYPDQHIYVRKGDQFAAYYAPSYEYRDIDPDFSPLTESEEYDEFEDERERYLIRTEYTLGEEVTLKGCGPDMESWKSGRVIHIDDEHDCFIDALDPYSLYPSNIFGIPGFDPMEYA